MASCSDVELPSASDRRDRSLPHPRGGWRVGERREAEASRYVRSRRIREKLRVGERREAEAPRNVRLRRYVRRTESGTIRVGHSAAAAFIPNTGDAATHAPRGIPPRFPAQISGRRRTKVIRRRIQQWPSLEARRHGACLMLQVERRVRRKSMRWRRFAVRMCCLGRRHIQGGQAQRSALTPAAGALNRHRTLRLLRQSSASG
jgi:hypothetical protein